MQSQGYPAVSPDFGHWLAGFIDGEGTFAIHRQNVHRPRPGLACKLIVKLRDDDRAILDEIVERTGIGTVCWKKPGGDGRTNNAQVAWQVQSRGDCARAVELLDVYPLRAKKSRDYAIWREAVLLAREVRNGGPVGTVNAAVWERMEELREALARLHVYAASPS